MPIILIFSILISLFSCENKETAQTKDGIAYVQINISDTPSTIDPRQVRDLPSFITSKMIYEGLMRTNPEGITQEALAENVQISDDKRSYTFQLRPSKWSDGTELTAMDFERTWKESISPSFPSAYAFMLYPLKHAKEIKSGKLPSDSLGVKALDKNTLVVTLEQPTPYFLELLTLPIYFPSNNSEKSLANPLSPIANGPFILREWVDFDHVLLLKNEEYWDKEAVTLQGINFSMVDQATELALFENQQLNWAGSPLSTLSTEAIQFLKERPDYHTNDALGTHIFRFNTVSFPFNNKKLRQAFSYAIDRKSLTEHVLLGGQIPAMALVPPMVALQKMPYFKDHDKLVAQKLFEEAITELGIQRDKGSVTGLSYKEKPLTIEFSYMADERNHKIAQTVQQQWNNAFNIQVNLDKAEHKHHVHKVKTGDYQIANGSWIGDFKDPINFLEVFKESNGTNNTGWVSSKYQQLLDASGNSSVSQLRLNLLNQAEELLMDEMPIAPVFFYTFSYLQSRELEDVYLSELGHLDFKWAKLNTVNQ